MMPVLSLWSVDLAVVGIACAWVLGRDGAAQRRIRELHHEPRSSRRRKATRASARPGPMGSLIVVIGTWIAHAVTSVMPGRPAIAMDEKVQRRLGCAALVALVAAVVWPPLGLMVMMGALTWLERSARRSRSARRRAIVVELPMVVDVLRITVSAGGNVITAIELLCHHLDGPLVEELRQVVSDVARGRRLAEALDDLPRRAGEDVRHLVSTLTASERYGASLSESLERLSHEVRLDQEHAAEQAARRLSVQLLFPLAGCTLPAFALLTMAPLLAGAFSGPVNLVH